MCGIAGIYRRRGWDEADPLRLLAMTGAIAHRGPDDFGYLLLDSRDGRFQLGQAGFSERPCDVCLGNRRLSIIDLSPNGRQPLSNESGDIFAVFNGEIFNYVELREELATRGHVFHSQTDTEVIVHAYEEWGEECVTRFNGMWALALWDQRRRELFCSRDRFGVKPFYYYLDQDVFIFASEIKGILPALAARPGANYGVLSDYLIEESLCRSADTFFDGIQRLEAAHNLVVTAGGIRNSRYWDYQTQSQVYDYGRPVETFRELFHDAVRFRLRSDVPVGVALSGGLDSTAILASAADIGNSRGLKAFTAVFPGRWFDEQEYARLASEACGAELFCVDYPADDFMDDLRDITWSLESPTLDGQVLPRWHILRLASRHVKVILEGQGADEMLAGYITKCFGAYLIDELGRMKSAQNHLALTGLLKSFAEMHRQHGWPVYGGLLRQLVPAWLLREYRRVWRQHGVYTREFAGWSDARREAPAPRVFEDRLTSLLHYDHSRGILPRLLQFGDALSMAFSMESRLPFLDHRLVEFVFGLPAHHKLEGAVSKGILREAMAGVIPERIRLRRDKVGFNTPLSQWIGQNLDSSIRPMLLSRRCQERGIFDPKKVERVLDQQAQGRVRAERSIFRWLSAELWFRLFMDGEATPLAERPLVAAASRPGSSGF